MTETERYEAECDRILVLLEAEGNGELISHEQEVADRKMQLLIDRANEEFWHSHEFWQEEE